MILFAKELRLSCDLVLKNIPGADQAEDGYVIKVDDIYQVYQLLLFYPSRGRSLRRRRFRLVLQLPESALRHW